MITIPIEKDTNTSFRIPFENNEILITIRFLSIASIWTMDIDYKAITFRGLKLSCGVLMLKSQNLPFDFMIYNESRNGLDPFKKDDFTSNKYSINLIERKDLDYLRGYEVE